LEWWETCARSAGQGKLMNWKKEKREENRKRKKEKN
jgi:hypothetical protein